MDKKLWNLLEVLGHHIKDGAVWDGDQIDKYDRDRLIQGGYLKRSFNGYTTFTHAGKCAWRRWVIPYKTFCFLKYLKWNFNNCINYFY